MTGSRQGMSLLCYLFDEVNPLLPLDASCGEDQKVMGSWKEAGKGSP